MVTKVYNLDLIDFKFFLIDYKKNIYLNYQNGLPKKNSKRIIASLLLAAGFFALKMETKNYLQRVKFGIQKIA